MTRIVCIGVGVDKPAKRCIWKSFRPRGEGRDRARTLRTIVDIVATGEIGTIPMRYSSAIGLGTAGTISTKTISSAGADSWIISEL